ncbi:hypothetical protein, partial [Streptomyces sp. NRRL F-5123]|uniref:hypothetical protein n=1 Tax=Streptomyces sp. NRRL F-5123 TaxID=1463856 RepID=UPI001F1B3109
PPPHPRRLTTRPRNTPRRRTDMAGAYCKFCGNRCFVYRIIPDGPQKGWAGHLATCAPGMAHDREKTGYDHTTATNPIQAD